MKIEDQNTLDLLYWKTSFTTPQTWQGLKVHQDPFETHVHVPQCSHLGDTLISLDDTYEDSGWDCFFIQELLRLYQEGKLRIVQR